MLNLFPQVCFSFALLVLGVTNVVGGDEEGEGEDDFEDDFDPFNKYVRRSLTYMACEVVVYTIFLLLIERYVFCVH